MEYLIPTTLSEALSMRAACHPTPYGGGTDLMVEAREDANYLFLHQVKELRQIYEEQMHIIIGAECTFTQIQKDMLTPPLLREAVSQIAAPAIRNLGTIGGNVGNGSAKADSVLALLALGALVRVANRNGTRTIPIRSFYLGRKQLDLHENELIVALVIPKAHVGGYAYQKIGARKALAISRVSFAGVVTWENNRISYFAAAFGAVSDTVFTMPTLDAQFVGKTRQEAAAFAENYVRTFDAEFIPISGRISAEYRKSVCRNLLCQFLNDFFLDA